jgi:hypothetical protein
MVWITRGRLTKSRPERLSLTAETTKAIKNIRSTFLSTKMMIISSLCGIRMEMECVARKVKGHT